ncbi:MAG TPA: carboxypeptidase regulatory-like domain-containing protein, partial [Pyrinomonadaceae bacterium]|nr:carboxypeptidase regulatory-like domain-containing protein [Pyrinomonadaceae bacterium]
MRKRFNILICTCVMLACAAFARADVFTLHGVVVDQNGAPIAAAQVSLYASPTLIAQTTTSATGEFTFSELGINRGVVKVRAAGFAEVTQDWTAGDTRLRITLVPLSIRELVVVTPTRTSIQLNETAASVAVVSATALEQTSALRLDDALRQVAGFQLFRRSGSRTANPTTQ